jgi:hypothetical protein
MVARKTHLSRKMQGINFFDEINFVNFSGFENAQNLLRRGREGMDKCSKLAQKREGGFQKRPKNAHMINERSLTHIILPYIVYLVISGPPVYML